MFGVNLKGAYWGCAAAARAMTSEGKGSIINISSISVDSANPGLSAYFDQQGRHQRVDADAGV